MSFEIGRVQSDNETLFGLRNSYAAASVSNNGVELCVYGPTNLGMITISADQAREFGELLITAADNWQELTSRIKQVDQETKRFNDDRKSWIKGALSKRDK